MVKNIGRNSNTTDEATVADNIALNSLTSTNLVASNATRIFLSVRNNAATKAVWLKLQDESVDNDKKGIYLAKKGEGENTFTMATDNIYTGAISAIADGGLLEVSVTEY